MKRRIYFKSVDDLIIFKDIKSEFSFYGITKNVYHEIMQITENYDRKEGNLPDEYKIKCSPIKYVKPKDDYTDIYEPSGLELIDFPINRIEWIFIQCVQP